MPLPNAEHNSDAAPGAEGVIAEAGAPLTTRLLRIGALGIGLLVITALLGVLAGSSGITPLEVLAVFGGGGEPATRQIVLTLRLPAVVLAAGVGALLAGSGVVTQTILRNPLADPYVLGVSGGAAVGVAVAALVLPDSMRAVAVPGSALGGALISLLLLHQLGRRISGAGRDVNASLLLAGVVFNSLASALILLLHTVLAPNRSQELLFSLVGAILPSRVSGPLGLVLAVAATASIVFLLARAHRINLLALGDEAAGALGLDVVRERLALLVAVSLAVACAVSSAGMIGFVGLVVPHALRRVVGADVRLLLPASLLGGAVFVVCADAVARTAFGAVGAVLPVGVVTALVGAPLFVFLLATPAAATRGARHA
jgi:iron complex transport system permease protein